MKKVIRPSMPAFPKSTLATNPVNDAYANKVVGGAPVAFSAQAELAANEIVVLNAQTLQSGFRTPYFIDEIRVSMMTSPYDATTVGDSTTFPTRAFTGLSGAVDILFQTGDKMFSADFVPTGLMAPIFGPLDYGSAYNDTVATVTRSRAFSTVRWLLPKPLFMPAGDVVLANVRLNDPFGVFGDYWTSGAKAVKVTVTYIGRLVPPGYTAKTRDVPWLAWFSKLASESWKSSQTRFRNPFLIPAHVQRFVSRTYAVKYESASPVENYFSELWQTGQVPSTAVPYQELKMDDSRGYSIVPRYAPIGMVFDATRKVWTFGRELTSREQFNMEIRNALPTPALAANTDYLTNIGLIGYRTEDV